MIIRIKTRSGALLLGRLFYAFGTGLGGIIGPTLFGQLIQTQQRSSLLIGYLIGAALMGVAEGVQAVWGGAAERQALEQVARPLSQAGDRKG